MRYNLAHLGYLIRKRFPLREIRGCHDNSLYLSRWTLLRTRWFQVLLHQFHRSDEDRSLHDHPWPFVAIILKHGYWECTEEPGDIPGRITTRYYRPGSILRRPAKWAHRVEIDEKNGAWSLVITGPRVRKWGFWTETGWVHWKVWHHQNGCGDLQEGQD